MVRITNEILLERMSHIQEDITDIKDHLKQLNGQTLNNSEFRIRQTTVNKMFYSFIALFGVSIVTLVAKVI
jgi:hypothetical protein